MDKDYSAEVAALELELANAERELAQLQWQKEQLEPRSKAIREQCAGLGVAATLDAVDTELKASSAKLDQLLSQIKEDMNDLS